MSTSCPRCAAIDARSLSLIHRERLSIVPAHGSRVRDVAPPGKRNVVLWALVAGAFGLLFLESLSGIRLYTMLTGAACFVSGWAARHAHDYNSERYPVLLKNWEQSLMCSRCGEVFVSR